VTNPPYGVRLGGRAKAGGGPDLRNLYAQLGHVLRERFSGWRVAVLVAEPRLAHATGLRFDPGRTIHLVNGGLAIQLWQGAVG
jgi:putative N6-adenine-specific DNA methylase